MLINLFVVVTTFATQLCYFWLMYTKITNYFVILLI